MATTLFDLPPEIRIHIFKLIIVSPLSYIPLAPSVDFLFRSKQVDNDLTPELTPWHPTYPRELLLVCHQFYHEVRPLYFASNGFSLVLTRNNDPLDYFIAPSFMDNRREIRKLKLTLARWGRNDYFVRQLYPIVSDMILNGCLRDLEIQIKKKHLLLDGHQDSLKNGEAIRALRSLYEDPYLERVVVMISPKTEEAVKP